MISEYAIGSLRLDDAIGDLPFGELFRFIFYTPPERRDARRFAAMRCLARRCGFSQVSGLRAIDTYQIGHHSRYDPCRIGNSVMNVHAARDFSRLRHEMVETAIFRRSVRSELVLNAMRKVRREAFLSKSLHEFAYEDTPLPIEGGQTISQPYIVAFMIEALGLEGGERVLEIGAGSGYAAAVLSEIAGEVYTVERIGQLAEKAASTLHDLGYHRVHVLHGDGTKGWPEHAPYDGIVVAAGGPAVPDSLKEQRLVIPVGSDPRLQELVRVTRISENEYKREDLADVRFVPLVGEEGWETGEQRQTVRPARAIRKARGPSLAQEIAAACEPFEAIETAALEQLLARVGDARIVLIGEATHGTSEFYRMRARISRELIQKKDFRFVAVEGDWPDAARVDHYVRHLEYPPSEWTAFARFPTWMWRNNEVREFVDWLRAHNAPLKPSDRTAFHGLDLYSLYDSIRAVLKYLDEVDPATARAARERYGCLTPWQSDPATYGHAALTGAYPTCESEVAVVLTELLHKRRSYAEHDGERFMDAVQNARLVTNAEQYYRIMYYGSRASWNLRDSHMFETLKTLLAFYGTKAKAIIWAHNSHCGDAAATEMASRGEYNLCAGRSLALSAIRSVLALIRARSPQRRIGTGRWKSRRCAPPFRRVTSAVATRPVFRPFASICGNRS
jgi:protein-L-isoaspartate(D-aspartate) O-methyltransferase